MNKDTLETFRALSRQYSDSSIMMHEAIARKAGLSGTDHKYLGLLIQKGPMTAGELAKLTGLTTGAITGLIDRLEKKALVKRQYDKTDRRKVFIDNTMKLLEPLFAELQEKSVALIASFQDSEQKVIQRYFRAAIDVMNEVTINLNNK